MLSGVMLESRKREKKNYEMGKKMFSNENVMHNFVLNLCIYVCQSKNNIKYENKKFVVVQK